KSRITVLILVLALVAVARICQAVTWDPSFCSWEGTIPFCNSDCPAGNQFRCVTEKKSCETGHKGLCCPSVKQAECCRVMNGLHPNAHDTLREIDPDAAQRFYDQCAQMHNNDLSH
ncbi:hypothetical protein BGZ93_007326, partial [Podila epicladia]